jgi:hypothetical protein
MYSYLSGKKKRNELDVLQEEQQKNITEGKFENP